MRKRVGDPTRSWDYRISAERTEMLFVPFSDAPLETYVIEEKIRGHYRNTWRGTVTYLKKAALFPQPGPVSIGAPQDVLAHLISFQYDHRVEFVGKILFPSVCTVTVRE